MLKPFQYLVKSGDVWVEVCLFPSCFAKCRDGLCHLHCPHLASPYCQHFFPLWRTALLHADNDMQVSFSTSPMSKNTHWKQTVLYLEDKLTVCTGEVLTGTLACLPNALNPRDLDFELSYKFEGRLCTSAGTLNYRMRWTTQPSFSRCLLYGSLKAMRAGMLVPVPMLLLLYFDCFPHPFQVDLKETVSFKFLKQISFTDNARLASDNHFDTIMYCIALAEYMLVLYHFC